MSRKIFINLPVQDLQCSMDFFTALGFSFNPQFTDETAACLVIGEEIYAMLLTHAKFKELIAREICDTKTTAEVGLCLTCESRSEVDELADKAMSSGGQKANPPMDLGFMYLRSFQDPDGHIWEGIWMDPSAIAQASKEGCEAVKRGSSTPS